jgi:PAS domain S-box-containing protein
VIPRSDDSPAPNSNDDCFQQLADGAPVMIWMSGLDMGCFYFNRAWLEFRGRTLDQEFGNGWAEGVHPEDVERCVNHYVSCFERRMGFAMTYRLKNHEGEYRWILDRGAPHSLPDGTFLGFFGGCAEIDSQSPELRNAELRTRLAQVREYARQLAAEEHTLNHVLNASHEPTLKNFAAQLSGDGLQRLQRMQHATAQMGQLTADMIAFGNTPRGACLI